jgi:hypothetical protein
VVGVVGLVAAEAPLYYFVGLIFIVTGFFFSFSWYSISSTYLFIYLFIIVVNYLFIYLFIIVVNYLFI